MRTVEDVLKPTPVACAADRSKAVIWVSFLLHKNFRFSVLCSLLLLWSFYLFYCINIMGVGYNFI